MWESPSGAVTTVVVSRVATFQPSGTMNVLPSVSAHGVSPLATSTLGVAAGTAGAPAVVGCSAGGIAGGAATGFDEDEHAARSSAQKRLRMTAR